MTDEATIGDLIAAWAEAIRRQDMAGVLAHHAVEVLLFDVSPPLQLRGVNEYERAFAPFLAWVGETGQFTVDELAITAGDEVAFATGIIRVKDGNVRLTIGLRKVDGDWTIVHEHHSAPSS